MSIPDGMLMAYPEDHQPCRACQVFTGLYCEGCGNPFCRECADHRACSCGEPPLDLEGLETTAALLDEIS